MFTKKQYQDVTQISIYHNEATGIYTVSAIAGKTFAALEKPVRKSIEQDLESALRAACFMKKLFPNAVIRRVR